MSEPNYKSYQRGENLVEIKRFKEALLEFNEFLSADPQNYHALCNVSFCHLELDELRTAIGFANQAIAVSPESEWAYRLKSIIFRYSGDHVESLKAAKEAVSKAPNFEYSLNALIQAQINNFKLEDAKQTLDLMLQVAPDSESAHEALGLIDCKMDRFASAEKHFRQALKINPESSQSLSNLGSVYLEQSQRGFGPLKKSRLGKMAKDCFLAALKINPNLAIAKANLAAAENNRFFISSQKNRIVLSSFVFFIAIIIFARIINSFIPQIVNIYTPYQPRMYYVGINLIVAFFLIICTTHHFFLRRSDISIENLNRFYRKNKILVAIYSVVLLSPQIIGALFFVFLDIEMGSLAFVILFLTGAAFFASAIKIYQYFENEILE